MVDHNVIQKFLNEKNLYFFTVHTKADKVVKAIIRHLPGNTCAEDINVALQEIDYMIIVKQMTAKRHTPRRRGHTHLSPPFPSYTSKELKSSRIFKLTTLCNINIDPKMGLHNTTIVSLLVTSGCTSGSLLAAYGAGVPRKAEL
jgi:hypothetical protein